jgi:hypothetical protein
MSIPTPRRTNAFLCQLSLACCAICLLVTPTVAAGHAVKIITQADSVTIANEHLRVEIATQGRRVRTTRIENRRACRTLDLEGDDFVLELADGKVVAP